MRNSWQFSKKMNKMQTYAEMGNPWTRCNIFAQNFTQQLQHAKSFQSILEMTFLHHKSRDVWVLRHENRGSRVKNQECDMLVMLVMYRDMYHPIIIKQMVGSMSSQLCHCQTPKLASMQTLEATKNWMDTFSTSSTNWTPDTKEKAFMLNQRQKLLIRKIWTHFLTIP